MSAGFDAEEGGVRGGRRSAVSREVKQRGLEYAGTARPAAETADAATHGLSRRDLLLAGGGLGAAVMIGRAGRVAAAVRPSRSVYPNVAIVGAGLAGLSAAYQLHQVGVGSTVYEARDRLGGRCWTARGFADGQTAEHGGEFIDTRHVHLRQLARELGLELSDLFAARAGPYSPNLVGNRRVTQHELNLAMRPVAAAVAREARS